MGIQSSSATFTRFYVPDPDTEDFWSYVDERLQAGVFRELDDTQEQAVGFASWEDFFDSSFSYGSYHKGEYVAFTFRLEQRRVAPIVVKKYVKQTVQKYRDEHEGKWPSRQERQEIQENVKSWLLNRALPQPSACEVVWNPAANWMLLGTTSTRMMEAFFEHFEKHFQVYPVPLYHVQWALNLIPLEGRQKDFLGSLVSAKSPQAMEEGRFLGNEFLTWLWHLTEQSDDTIKLADDREMAVHLGERMVLSLPNEGRERVICTTQANALHEARTALRQGKMVDQLQLFLQIGDNEYLLNLDSALWAVRGLKAPKQMSDYDEEDPDGLFLEKMYFLEEVSGALSALYEKFLGERLSPAWKSDSLPLLQAWINNHGEPKASPAEGVNTESDDPPF